MNTNEKLAAFAMLVERQQRERMLRKYPAMAQTSIDRFCSVSIRPGLKFDKVDVGTSGKYMVDRATGEIFGIKGYGVVHRGKRFGTLDTIEAWNWGDYWAVPNREEVAPMR